MSDVISIIPIEECPSYHKCSAPLCPLDIGLQDRIWYADEPVCRSHKYGKHRWIRKQRSIVNRQTKSWLGKPITYQQLFDSSRPRKISPETKERLERALRKARQTKAERLNRCLLPKEVADSDFITYSGIRTYLHTIHFHLTMGK